MHPNRDQESLGPVWTGRFVHRVAIHGEPVRDNSMVLALSLARKIDFVYWRNELGSNLISKGEKRRLNSFLL